MEATVLGEDVVGSDGVGLVVGHPAGPVDAARLFVGHREQDQVAGRPKTAVSQTSKGHGLRGSQVQHVDGTSTPDLSVHHLSIKRVAAPAAWIHRNHVGVTHEAQRWGGGV